MISKAGALSFLTFFHLAFSEEFIYSPCLLQADLAWEEANSLVLKSWTKSIVRNRKEALVKPPSPIGKFDILGNAVSISENLDENQGIHWKLAGDIPNYGGWLYRDDNMNLNHWVFIYPDFETAIYGHYDTKGNLTWGAEIQINQMR